MQILLGLLLAFSVAEIVGLGYLIYRSERAARTFTPGEAAIFREMRRVLDEAK
jgi:hypothetical protein